MAGEVKYDTLPFIDGSGKDMLETGGDYKSVDYDNADYHSDALEHYSIDTSKSFNAFRNKYLDSSNTDFSDSIQKANKGGYQAKSVYEIIGEQVAKETPQQKYQRLQLELSELAAEVQDIKDTNSGATPQSNPVSLSQQVNSLQ